MISYIFLFISCLALVAYFLFYRKKDRYVVAVKAFMDDFDYFSTSIYMEQANNKLLCKHGMDMDMSRKQEDISIFSAKSFIDCVCVSIHMSLEKGDYSINDRRYILNIIKGDPEISEKMYENYVGTVSRMKVNKSLYIYDGINAIDQLSRGNFFELMNA